MVYLTCFLLADYENHCEASCMTKHVARCNAKSNCCNHCRKQSCNDFRNLSRKSLMFSSWVSLGMNQPHKGALNRVSFGSREKTKYLYLRRSAKRARSCSITMQLLIYFDLFIWLLFKLIFKVMYIKVMLNILY